MAQENQITRIIEVGVRQVNLNARDIGLTLAALAQENARARVSAGSVTDLTDSSGGTAGSGNALAAVVTPTVVAQDGVALLAPKTAFDTQIGLIEDAHEEIGVKAAELLGLIASASYPAPASIDAAATADDTIAAITVALTGSADADQGVEDATGIAQINQARNIQATLAKAVNAVRVAQGLAPITDGSGGSIIDYALPDAAATGTAAAAGENSLTEASVEAALSALRNNIASLAAALTEANAPAIGPFVVATQNPNWKFVAGDTTP